MKSNVGARASLLFTAAWLVTAGSLIHSAGCDGSPAGEEASSARSESPITALRKRYKVGDWDGDGRDNLAVLRGNVVLMDTNFDGAHDISQAYGNGNSEDR